MLTFILQILFVFIHRIFFSPDHNYIEKERLGEYVLDTKTDVTIGEGDTILSELFDKVVVTMKEGEQCYVKANCDVEGNKVKAIEPEEKKLKFKLHLFSLSRSADIYDLLVDEKLEKAEHYKNKGTEIYSNNLHYSQIRFKKALTFLNEIPLKNSSSLQQKQIRTLKIQCHLNLAAATLKTECYNEVVDHCTAALQMDPSSVKGLFRRAQALHKLHKYKEALEDLTEALVYEPDNRATLTLLKSVEASSLKEKLMYQKMFT